MVKSRKAAHHKAIQTEILSVATNMFVAKGFDQTTLRAIATATNYSPAAIYRYFESKEAILSAIFKNGFAEYARVMAPQRQENHCSTLRQSMHTYLQFAFDNHQLYRLMFMDEAPPSALNDPSIREIAQECFNNHQVLVNNAAIELGWEQSDDESLALSLWASLHGLASLHIAQRLFVSTVDITRQTNDIIDTLLTRKPRDP